MPVDNIFDKGLPASPDTERFVLGSVLMDYRRVWEHVESLTPDMFILEKHRRIFTRMQDIAVRGDAVDRVVLAEELIKWGQLESVDGLAYLSTLDDGLPAVPNIESYVKIIKDKHALRTVIFTAQRAIDQALMGEQSAESIASSLEESVRGIGEQKKEAGRTVVEVIRDYPNGIGAFLDPSTRPKGLQTPWAKFNQMTGGLHPRQLFVIGGYTGSGKSIIAGNMAMHVLETAKNPVLAFSMEMAASVWIERLLCAKAGVYRNRFKEGRMSPEERRRIQEALSWLSDSSLVIHDSSGMNAAHITKTVRGFAKKAKEPPLVVLDYLQLMGREKGSRVENRSNEVASNSRSMKMVCQETECMMLELSQLHRAGKGDGAPGVHNLRDSGAIEEDADGVGLLWLPGMNKQDRRDISDEAYLILDKVRDGERGRVPLKANFGMMRFEEVIEGPQDRD